MIIINAGGEYMIDHGARDSAMRVVYTDNGAVEATTRLNGIPLIVYGGSIPQAMSALRALVKIDARACSYCLSGLQHTPSEHEHSIARYFAHTD